MKNFLRWFDQFWKYDHVSITWRVTGFKEKQQDPKKFQKKYNKGRFFIKNQAKSSRKSFEDQ